MSGLGRMLRRLVSSVRSSFTKQELVGQDQLNNKYYRWNEVMGSHMQERRQVRVPGGDHLYNPNLLPTEWRMWLQKARADPPTPEELQRSAERFSSMKAKVAVLDEAERLRKLRLQGLGPQGAASPTSDMGSFVQQLGERHSQEQDGAPGNEAASSQQHRQPQSTAAGKRHRA